MTSPVDLDRVVSADEMVGDDETDTQQLREMLGWAEAYMRSFHWCPPVIERYLAFGIGGVVAVFLFKLGRKINEIDDWLWVVVGDLPSAYLVTDRARNAREVLSLYCELMDDWARAALSGRTADKIFPVNAPATPEVARMLLSRMQFIREQIIPEISRRESGGEIP